MENIKKKNLSFVLRENSQKIKRYKIKLKFCQNVDFIHNVELVLPVKICNLPFIPTIIKIIKKALMLSIQADVVGDRKGFL